MNNQPNQNKNLLLLTIHYNIQQLFEKEQNKTNKFENQLLLCQETIEKIKEMNNQPNQDKNLLLPTVNIFPIEIKMILTKENSFYCIKLILLHKTS